MIRRLLLALSVALWCAPAQAAFDAGDIICETTTTTGTGTVSLDGAATNYATFISQIATGSSVNYHITASDGKLETGVGVLTDATPDTLTRVAYWSTDGSGAELTLPAGTHTVCLGVTTQMIAGMKGIQLYTADAGAVGGILPFWHDSASAADGDIAADIQVFAGADDEEVGRIALEVDDGATTTEDTRWRFFNDIAGASVETLTLNLPVLESSGLRGHSFNIGSDALGGGLEVQSTSADGEGAELDLFHDSATPLAGDDQFVSFFGRDSAANVQLYGFFNSNILDPTSGSEDSSMSFQVMSGGAALRVLSLGIPQTPIGTFGHVLEMSGTSATDFGLHSTDGTAGGTFYSIHTDSATPAANDVIGGLAFYGEDSAGNKQEYFVGEAKITDPTSTSEDSRLELNVQVAGVRATALTLGVAALEGSGLYGHSFDVGSAALGGGVEFQSTSAGEEGAELDLFHDSTTPAAGDDQFVSFFGRDSAANATLYGFVNSNILDPTDGSEDSSMAFQVMNGGANLRVLSMGVAQTPVGTYGHAFEMGPTSASDLGLHSTDGTAGGTYYSIYTESATPAASDVIGGWAFYGEDSAGNKQEYFVGEAKILDATSTNEDSEVEFNVHIAGARVTALTIGPEMHLASGVDIEFAGGTANTFACTGGLCSIEGATIPTGAPDVQTMTATGSGDSWDKPTGGQRMCTVELWAGGGSGGRGAAAATGAGGGGGSYKTRDFRMADLGATEQVTVATGGAAQGSASTDGNAGGNTTFGAAATLITAYGGGGGDGSTGPGAGGGGGGGVAVVGSVGNGLVGGASDGVIGSATLVVDGPYGSPGGNGVAAAAGIAGGSTYMGGAGGGGAAGDATSTNAPGGASMWGGGGGGAGAEDAAPGPGAGGVSQFGGSGGAGNEGNNVAVSGVQPGGGGGGSETANSGAGGNGQARITCW